MGRKSNAKARGDEQEPDTRSGTLARDRLKAKIRELTGRNRGCSLSRMIGELATYLRGWKAYFGGAQRPTVPAGRDMFASIRAWGRAAKKP